MYPTRNSCISLRSEQYQQTGHAFATMTGKYLRPTAAFFLSDLHIKKSVTSMAMPQSIIEPETVSGALDVAV